MGELTLPPVCTCDGDVLPATSARLTSKLYYYVGFVALPWLWLCNVWLFSADFWHARDPVVAKCEPGCPWRIRDGSRATLRAPRSRASELRLSQPNPRHPLGPPPLAVQTRGDQPWALLFTPVSSCLGLRCT